MSLKASSPIIKISTSKQKIMQNIFFNLDYVKKLNSM